MYGGYIQRIAECFESEFKEIQAVYGFDHGPEFEVALCKALRRFLPTRFGIVRGFVVNEHDEMAGDDIIIFEQTRFPTLGIRDGDFSVKEKVPIEAVYAYIEAKHTLNISGDDGQSLSKALKQVEAVKRVCAPRKAASVFEGVTFSGADVESPPGYPDRGNPVFAAVFARFLREKGGQSTPPDDPLPLLRQAAPIAPLEFAPDLLVLGGDHVAFPVLEERNAYHSPFFIPGSSAMTVVQRHGLAFGLGMASLMAALDWVKLGPMPWKRILADGAGMLPENNP